MFSACVGNDIGAVEMIFRSTEVSLCPTPGERALHDTGWFFIQARGAVIKMAHQKTKLVHPFGRGDVPVAYVDLVFLKVCIRARLRQDRSAYALILYGAPLVGISDPELIIRRKIVKDAAGAEEVPRRIGHIVLNQSIHPLRMD